jgi:hypothetical protein
VLSCVHAADLNHLAAMLRSVRYAPPHSPPATAHLRILRGGSQGSGDQPWIWAEVKLSSDVRTSERHARALARALARPGGTHARARAAARITVFAFALCTAAERALNRGDAGRVHLLRTARRDLRKTSRRNVAPLFAEHKVGCTLLRTREHAARSLTRGARLLRCAATTCARPRTACSARRSCWRRAPALRRMLTPCISWMRCTQARGFC